MVVSGLARRAFCALMDMVFNYLMETLHAKPSKDYPSLHLGCSTMAHSAAPDSVCPPPPLVPDHASGGQGP